MPRRMEDKVLLITGATGIAAAAARLAALEGAGVFLVARERGECASLAGELAAAHAEADYADADVTDPSAVAAAVDACVARFGRIDALFNVAGISGRRFGDGPVHECSEDGWDATLAGNTRGTFLVCRAVLRQMLAQPVSAAGGRGAILNMASVLAFAPQAGHFATHAYAASKGAVIALSKAMAAYYAPQRIRVNAIAPSLVRTPMSRRAQDDPVILELMKTKQPLAGDLLEPEDVARQAVFLLSDDARAITGTVATVDGGWCVSG